MQNICYKFPWVNPKSQQTVCGFSVTCVRSLSLLYQQCSRPTHIKQLTTTPPDQSTAVARRECNRPAKHFSNVFYIARPQNISAHTSQLQISVRHQRRYDIKTFEPVIAASAAGVIGAPVEPAVVLPRL
jgi:hypothetical protein